MDYEIVKEFLLNNLRKIEGDLTTETLSKEIKNLEAIIAFNNSTPDNIIFKKNIDTNKIDFSKLQKEIETYFAITVKEGVLLSVKKDRDSQWWSNKLKQENENFYWDRYKKYISQKLNNTVVKTLDEDTDVIMDNIENPQLEEFDVRGMVVGHVQSGKTGNYSGLLCKAADAGYKFIVVIAGGMNNLRNQTQKRLNEYFVGTDNNQDLEIKKYGIYDNSKQPISLTTSKSDFNKKDADNSLNFDNSNSPILAVIKKNVKTLDNVIAWLSGSKEKKIRNHAILLIDDESDYASVNYNEENDPTKINSKIRELLNLFQKKSYVAYTATPFANIFIDYKAETEAYGKDLFPKDFIYSLDAPSNYSGAKRYFLSSGTDGAPQLINIEDYEDIFPLSQKKAFSVFELPPSLKEAIRCFILNISIRYLRGQVKDSNSMLIHVSRFTDVHSDVSSLVLEYYETLKEAILAFGKLKNPEHQSEEIMELKETFEKRYKNVEYNFSEVLKNTVNFIKGILIREVHQKSKLVIDYKEPINVIAIGGVSLSRGYTLEGLSVSYFIRNSLFYDTLMQMARWFGYRNNYEDLCKLFTPREISDNFIRIDEAIDELDATLVEMRDQGKTPEDFGLWVRFFPDSQLQVTARNKTRDTKDIVFKMNLSGIFKERAVLDIDDTIRKNINNNMDKLVEKLIKIKGAGEKVDTNYLWRDIDSNILLEFLKSISNNDENDIIREMCGAFPLRGLIEYFSQKNKNEKVDICLYSTKRKDYNINNFSIGTQERTFEKRNSKTKTVVINRRKVSSANPEKVILNEVDRKNEDTTGKIIRKMYMKKPLFMLHYLKEKNSNSDTVYGTFGIAFPLGNLDITKAISLKVNKVYIDKYLSTHDLEDDNYEE